jgi:glutathione S-transferase
MLQGSQGLPMPKLYQSPLDPASRRVRMAMGEYGIDIDLIEERPGQPSDALQELNPAGLTPVLIEDDRSFVVGIEAIGEYLEETRSTAKTTLLGKTPAERAETRRLVAWFDRKFYSEVSEPLLTEKLHRRFLPRELGGGPPDMSRVRAAQGKIRVHLDYIGALADERNWLAGANLSLADLAAAAHLSCLDFLAEVPWSDASPAKAWYQRIKSRPSFRPLLSDYVRGITPPPNYADLDF